MAAESKRENKGCVCTEFKLKPQISFIYIKQFTARLAAKIPISNIRWDPIRYYRTERMNSSK